MLLMNCNITYAAKKIQVEPTLKRCVAWRKICVPPNRVAAPAAIRIESASLSRKDRKFVRTDEMAHRQGR